MILNPPAWRYNIPGATSFPDDEIYLFSTIAHDRVLDKYDPIRIPIDIDLINDPLDPADMANSVVIFDDVDTIQKPKLRQAVSNFRDWLLECGRHHNIRLLMTSHQLMNYKSTRLILTEATSVTFFTRAGSTYHVKRFLKQYCGLEKGQIKKILNLPTRSVTIYKSYPNYVLYDKGVYLLTNEDD